MTKRLLVVMAVLLGACSSSPSAPAVALDGSPRVPDIEGVVTSVSRERLSLDGDRKYPVDDDLIAFSTYNRRAVALAGAKGKYVHIGLRDGEVVWLGQIGVVQVEDTKRTVVYQGNLKSVSGRRMTFADGTVLRLAPGLTPPADVRGSTLVVIDPDRHVVQGATFAPAATTTTRPDKS